jgi:hypothetical protein
MHSQLELATEPHASRLRPLSAFGRSRQDQVPLEVCKTAEYSDHQLAMCACRIAPGIAERLETCASLGNRSQGYSANRELILPTCRVCRRPAYRLRRVQR